MLRMGIEAEVTTNMTNIMTNITNMGVDGAHASVAKGRFVSGGGAEQDWQDSNEQQLESDAAFSPRVRGGSVSGRRHHNCIVSTPLGMDGWVSRGVPSRTHSNSMEARMSMDVAMEATSASSTPGVCAPMASRATHAPVPAIVIHRDTAAASSEQGSQQFGTPESKPPWPGNYDSDNGGFAS